MSCEIRVTIGPIKGSVSRKKKGELSAADQQALKQEAETEVRANMDAELSRRAAFIRCSGTCTPHFRYPSITVTSSVSVNGWYWKDTVATAEATGMLVVECSKSQSDANMEPAEEEGGDDSQPQTEPQTAPGTPGHSERPVKLVDSAFCPCDEGVITLAGVSMSGEAESPYMADNEFGITLEQVKRLVESDATTDAIRKVNAELVALAAEIQCTGNCNKVVASPVITSSGPASSTDSFTWKAPSFSWNNRKVEGTSQATGSIQIRCRRP